MTEPTLPTTPTPEMIEAMARALCEQVGDDPDQFRHDGLTQWWLMWEEDALAAYTALLSHMRGKTE